MVERIRRSIADYRREHVRDISAQLRAVIGAAAVGKIDDVHFLDLSDKEGKLTNDHLKHLADTYLQPGGCVAR